MSKKNFNSTGVEINPLLHYVTEKSLVWNYDGIVLKNIFKKIAKDFEKIKKMFIKIRNPNSNTFKKGQIGLRRKKVMMFDLNWKLIREFESAKLAGDYVGVTGGTIQFACINYKKATCKKYKWKYK